MKWVYIFVSPYPSPFLGSMQKLYTEFPGFHCFGPQLQAFVLAVSLAVSSGLADPTLNVPIHVLPTSLTFPLTYSHDVMGQSPSSRFCPHFSSPHILSKALCFTPPGLAYYISSQSLFIAHSICPELYGNSYTLCLSV